MSHDIAKRTFTGTGNYRLVADAGGDPSAPAVVLLHGGGQTRHSWGKAQRDLIDTGYYVVSVDARGHGESDWISNGDYSLEAQVGDVVAVVNSIGGKPALVGASMGGVNALIACGTHPDLASALVLVDVTPRLEPQGVAHIHNFMSANPDGFASVAEADDAVAAYNPTRPRPRNLDGLSKNLRLRDNGRWYWHWDPNFIAGDRHLKLARIADRMRKASENIKLPALLVRGQQSDVVSPEGVAEFRTLMPHLEFADIQGAGHMIAGDRNDAFNAAVHDFLLRHLPPA
ncbi:alpha/beta fold hydrolase [Noviherbaspirillum saxi]|uniref:Alpha/beta hydrolase n=1 Tax=Noviherbaspirillum saxi TaxID=2320863 RepID=A0A3A3G0U3_9BURK|nr:alpha/beta hydrolase [Noviherbaspirillum saxi]RJF91693.1 alpha/beta hydrolase [Noviherbaspirillum saxi]